MKLLKESPLYFNSDLVANSEYYSHLPEFNLLCDFLRRKNVIIKAEKQLPWGRTSFEKLYWRASHYSLLSYPDKKPGTYFVAANSMIHHGIHYLMAHRFGPALKARPQLTLLMESVASSADIYFSIMYFREHGIYHPFVNLYLSTCVNQAKIPKHKILNFLKNAPKNPFSVYKKIVLELFDVTLTYLSWCSTEKQENFELTVATRKWKNLKYRFLYDYLDLEVFMIYVLGFCGTRSSLDDLKKTKELKKILLNSRSMNAFLITLRNTARNYV